MFTLTSDGEQNVVWVEPGKMLQWHNPVDSLPDSKAGQILVKLIEQEGGYFTILNYSKENGFWWDESCYRYHWQDIEKWSYIPD